MIKQILALLAMTLLIISCGEKSGEPADKLSPEKLYTTDSTDLVTQGVDESGKPFMLQYKFKKDDKYTYRLSTSSTTSQTITTDTSFTMSATQNIIYIVDMLTKEVESDGSGEMEFTISSLKLNANVNGQLMTFEAGKDNDSSKVEQFAEFYALYKSPFNARFNGRGEILDLFKAEKISNKYLELRKLSDSVSTDQKESIKNELISGILKPLITQIIRKLPENEVYTDSTWEITQPPFQVPPFQINYTNKFKVKNVEKMSDDRIAVIDAGVDYIVNGQTNIKQGEISYQFKKPVSTAEGKLFFNVDRGLLMKSKTKTMMDMSFVMTAPTPQGVQSGKRQEVVTNSNVLELLD